MPLPKTIRGLMLSLGLGVIVSVAMPATRAEAAPKPKPPAVAPTLAGCTAGNVFDTTTNLAVNGCQFLTPSDNSNVASIGNINAAGFFGYSDWKSNGQDQLGGAGSVGQNGTWAISNVNFAARDYIIVFKDGDGTNLIAFSFNESYASGKWTSPFTNPPFTELNAGQTKDVSHLTIAYRETGPVPAQDIPEPATLALFGAGLTGLGLTLRRRRRAA